MDRTARGRQDQGDRCLGRARGSTAAGRRYRAARTRGRLARRSGDPGPRAIPDPRIRGPLYPDRAGLSHHRRFPILRARRNPRSARLSARHRTTCRRSRLRADLQPAQARARRQDARRHAAPREAHGHAARRRVDRFVRQRRIAGPRAQYAQEPAPAVSAVARGCTEGVACQSASAGRDRERL